MITKWSSLTVPSTLEPRPTTIFLRTRSFISIHLFHVTHLGSIPSSLPCCIWLSRSAAHKLLADVIAWKSPVKCRLSSSIGTTCAYPPPAAPPLIPKARQLRITSHLNERMPSFPNASPSPTVIVVFPSPAGVGLMAVTRINFPSSLSLTLLMYSSDILALYFPYNSRSSSLMPHLAATFLIGSITASCAISMSVFIMFLSFALAFSCLAIPPYQDS